MSLVKFEKLPLNLKRVFNQTAKMSFTIGKVLNKYSSLQITFTAVQTNLEALKILSAITIYFFRIIFNDCILILLWIER